MMSEGGVDADPHELSFKLFRVGNDALSALKLFAPVARLRHELPPTDGPVCLFFQLLLLLPPVRAKTRRKPPCGSGGSLKL